MSNNTQSSDPSGVSHQRYLIGIDQSQAEPNNVLVEVLEQLQADPQARIEEIKGQPTHPYLLVASLTPEQVQELKAQYQGKLILEPEGPLHLLQS